MNASELDLGRWERWKRAQGRLIGVGQAMAGLAEWARRGWRGEVVNYTKGWNGEARERFELALSGWPVAARAGLERAERMELRCLRLEQELELARAALEVVAAREPHWPLARLEGPGDVVGGMNGRRTGRDLTAGELAERWNGVLLGIEN